MASIGEGVFTRGEKPLLDGPVLGCGEEMCGGGDDSLYWANMTGSSEFFRCGVGWDGGRLSPYDGS